MPDLILYGGVWGKTNTPFTLASQNGSERSGTVLKCSVNGTVLFRSVPERNGK